ncbi:MAG: hypothetical protein R6W92_12325, partial [Desulfocurvibacter africanus]
GEVRHFKVGWVDKNTCLLEAIRDFVNPNALQAKDLAADVPFKPSFQQSGGANFWVHTTPSFYLISSTRDIRKAQWFYLPAA